MKAIHNALATLGLLSAMASCGATPEQPEGTSGSMAPGGATDSPEPARPLEFEAAPWTDYFDGAAVLVADRIRIEGPPGLLEHLVLRADDDLFERTVKTTPEGLLQTLRPRQLAEGGRELARGQLDAWQLAATGEIVALERPGDVPVSVVAEGEAFWRDPNGEQRRGSRLAFEAPVEVPDGDGDAGEGSR